MDMTYYLIVGGAGAAILVLLLVLRARRNKGASDSPKPVKGKKGKNVEASVAPAVAPNVGMMLPGATPTSTPASGLPTVSAQMLQPAAPAEVETPSLKKVTPSQKKYIKQWAKAGYRDRLHGLPGGAQVSSKAEGEAVIKVANTINSMLGAEQFADVEVYHNVRVFGESWDTDHILSYGDVIVVINTKALPAKGTYSLNFSNQTGRLEIFRDGNTIENGGISSPTTRMRLEKFCPDYKIFCLVVADTPKGVIEENLQATGVGFVREDKLVSRLEYFLAQANPEEVTVGFDEDTIDLNLVK